MSLITNTPKFYLTCIGFVFILTSCETDTYYDYYIANHSSSKINITGKNILYSSPVDRSISTGETEIVATYQREGKETDTLTPLSVFGQTLVITNLTGDTLKKSYKLLKNWEVDINPARKSAKHKYTFVLVDTDF